MLNSGVLLRRSQLGRKVLAIFLLGGGVLNALVAVYNIEVYSQAPIETAGGPSARHHSVRDPPAAAEHLEQVEAAVRAPQPPQPNTSLIFRHSEDEFGAPSVCSSQGRPYGCQVFDPARDALTPRRCCCRRQNPNRIRHRGRERPGHFLEEKSGHCQFGPTLRNM